MSFGSASQLVSVAAVDRVEAEGLLAAVEAVGLGGVHRDSDTVLGSLLLSIVGSEEDARECTVHRRILKPPSQPGKWHHHLQR